MQVGFVIDQRKCIGCHACTVACKAENDVPVGSFRTWVKYTEKGIFPRVRRHFSVLRCNHCDAAPCIEICPVVALHKRPDAIVDLDRDLCIGCRACMQACPYDALYLNEDTGTAEKCHYCAHRVERGMEPACVIVCPVHAIISGDTSNESSEIATLLRAEPAEQRKLDKGTKPRVWYIDALPESLVPGDTSEPPLYLWSDRMNAPPEVPPHLAPPADVITSLNAPHPPTWGWHVWSYLTTKNIAAGAMLAAPFTDWFGIGGGAAYTPELTALLFLGVTMAFLVHDLGRPERFLKIIFHPNWKSWLVKGAYVLMVFGGLTSAAGVARYAGMVDAARLLRWINVPAAVMASGYTAFLFSQCRGRDLWLEPGLFYRLILRAAWLGAAMLLLLSSAPAARFLFLGFAVVEQVWVWVDARRRMHTRDGEHARTLMYADQGFKVGRALLAVSFLAAAVQPWAPPAAFAAVLAAIAGLVLVERAWIDKGQAVLLS